MGTFFYPITLIGPSGRRRTVEALVDTGATFTSVPTDILEELGVEPRRQVNLRLADGSLHTQPLGRVVAELDETEEITFVIFGDPGSPSTIGAVTLETFLLGVDPRWKTASSGSGMAGMSSTAQSWWYYQNRRAVSGKDATVHHASCRHCNDGRGQRGSANPGQRARWKGPFESSDNAIFSARAAGRTLMELCPHCG